MLGLHLEIPLGLAKDYDLKDLPKPGPALSLDPVLGLGVKLGRRTWEVVASTKKGHSAAEQTTGLWTANDESCNYSLQCLTYGHQCWVL